MNDWAAAGIAPMLVMYVTAGVAEARYHVVERGPRRGRSMVGPEVVDQLIGGTELSRMEEQGRNEGPKQLAAQL